MVSLLILGFIITSLLLWEWTGLSWVECRVKRRLKSRVEPGRPFGPLGPCRVAAWVRRLWLWTSPLKVLTAWYYFSERDFFLVNMYNGFTFVFICTFCVFLGLYNIAYLFTQIISYWFLLLFSFVWDILAFTDETNQETWQESIKYMERVCETPHRVTTSPHLSKS